MNAACTQATIEAWLSTSVPSQSKTIRRTVSVTFISYTAPRACSSVRPVKGDKTDARYLRAASWDRMHACRHFRSPGRAATAAGTRPRLGWSAGCRGRHSIWSRARHTATLPRQRLDLYLPHDPRARRRLVVFLYGGGWDAGARRTYRFIGQMLAASGFAVAIPDYRLYPEARFPDFIEDTAAAVAWLAHHAGDARRRRQPDRARRPLRRSLQRRHGAHLTRAISKPPAARPASSSAWWALPDPTPSTR